MNVLSKVDKTAIKFMEQFDVYEIYLVGGACRDMVLDRTPKDYDFTTNATPIQVIELFELKGYKTIATGINYGTVTVLYDNETYEVTTYRLETDYDGRRPNVIKYASNLTDDLQRRDFTINALAMGLDGDLIDMFGGIDDLENGVIKCVGKASDRIGDDKLRALRAIRFASRYDFTIDEDILLELSRVDLSQLSRERVRDELIKILSYKDSFTYLYIMLKYGILEQIIPQIGKRDIYKRVVGLNSFFYSIESSMATLLSNLAESVVIESLRGLRFTNHQISLITRLIRGINIPLESISTEYQLKLFISKLGVDIMLELFQLRVTLATDELKQEEIDCYFRYLNLIKQGDPLFLKDLAINGNDLLTIGINGKDVGAMLNDLLDTVLACKNLNSKEILIRIAEETVKC